MGVEEYSSAAEFQADEQRHCVTSDSVYAWKEGGCRRLHLKLLECSCVEGVSCFVAVQSTFWHSKRAPVLCRPPAAPKPPCCVLCAGQTQRLYGWLVGSYHALDRPVPLPRMERLHRSLYKVVEEEGAGTA